MKTKKIIELLRTPQSSGRTTAITIVAGGLVVAGAVGVLFATERGKIIRQKICDTFSSLFDKKKASESSEPVFHSRDHYAGKRPKSDIKSIIHNAHAAHTEQSLG